MPTMWYVYQVLIFFAVMTSNFYWRWTNDYAAALVAGCVSFVAIWLISKAISPESE
jgi:hypothetical protein